MANSGAYKMIYPSNGYLVKQTVRVFDQSTNTFTLTGLLALTVTFSSTADGANPITGLTQLPLTPLTSFPGVYARAIAGTLTVALAPFAGTLIYQIVQNPALNGLRVVTPLLVQTYRDAL
jgi:hypothetical protein